MFICRNIQYILFTTRILPIYFESKRQISALVRYRVKKYSPTVCLCLFDMIGLMTGYILHVYRNKEFKISRVLNLVLWLIVFLLAYLMVYSPYWIDNGYEYRAYYTTKKTIWGICLSWITISCIKV